MKECIGIKEAERLAGWCADNNLALIASKTKRNDYQFPQGKESNSLPN